MFRVRMTGEAHEQCREILIDDEFAASAGELIAETTKDLLSNI